MPLYQYICPDGHWTEEWRTYQKAAEPGVCDSCRQETKRGYMSAPAMRMGSYKVPAGCVEIGNEDPEPKPIRHELTRQDYVEIGDRITAAQERKD